MDPQASLLDGLDQGEQADAVPEETKAPPEEPRESTREEEPRESAPEGQEADGATADDAGTTEKAPKPKQETVPHAALHQAREQVKQLKAQIAQLEGQPKLSAEDAALLQELREAKQAGQDKEPDFLADPKGYVDTKVAAALKRLDDQQQATKETEKKVTDKEEREAVFRTTASAEAAFVAAQPDYPQALQYLREQRAAELQEMFPEATEEQVRNHIAFEELQTARALVAQNRNPAQFAYSFARIRGYQAPKTAAKPAAKADKSAARTLGSGGGDGAPSPEENGAGGMSPEFGQALQERFRRKSA